MREVLTERQKRFWKSWHKRWKLEGLTKKQMKFWKRVIKRWENSSWMKEFRKTIKGYVRVDYKTHDKLEDLYCCDCPSERHRRAFEKRLRYFKNYSGKISKLGY